MRRNLLVLGMVGALLIVLPVHAQEAATDRIGDAEDPVAAALDVSQATFEDDSATIVLLGRDDVFADSLAGAALAGTRGPLLYVPGGPDGTLPDDVLAEIDRVLLPGGCETAEVAILGGPSAVSEAIEDAVEAAGHCVTRYQGESRVETAISIAEALPGTEAPVFLARADEWADAATGGALAAVLGSPVLVTGSDALHPAVDAHLAAHPPSGIVLLGGTAALSEAVATAAAEHASTQRVAGPARDATAVAIADELWGTPDSGAVLIGGFASDGWVYALACAGPAGRAGTPELYVQADTVPAVVRNYLDRARPQQVTACGPASRIAEGTLLAAATPSPPTPGLSGITVDGVGVDALVGTAFGGLRGLDVELGVSAPLTEPGEVVHGVAWTHGGSGVAAQVGNAGAIQRFDVAPDGLVGPTAELSVGDPPCTGPLHPSPSGTHLLLRCGLDALVVPLDGSGAIHVPAAAVDFYPSATWDGEQVLAVRFVQAGSTHDLVHLPHAGPQAGAVVPVPGSTGDALDAVTVCGAQVVVHGFEPTGRWGIRVLEPGGYRLVATAPYEGQVPELTCSPDGRTVAYALQPSEIAGVEGPSPAPLLVTVDLVDGATRTAPLPEWFSPPTISWHPAGDQLLVVADELLHAALPLTGATPARVPGLGPVSQAAFFPRLPQ